MRKKAFFFAIALSCIIFSSSVFALDWIQSGHDLNNSNYQHETLNLTNGLVPVWNFTNLSEDFDTTPAVVNGIVYIGTSTSIIALNTSAAGDSALLWRYSDGFPVNSTPALFDGKVYFGSNSGNLTVLYADNGSLAWTYETSVAGLAWNSPAIDASNGIVYFAGQDVVGNGMIFALNAANGSEIWKEEDPDLGPEFFIYGSPVVAGGMLYIPDGGAGANGILQAYNATNGSLIWRYSIPTVTGTTSPPCYSNGIVYIPDTDNNVFALNATNGSLIWTHNEGSLGGNPVEIDGCAVRNGVIYTQNFNGTIFALNATNGTPIWNFQSGTYEQIIAQSPSVSDNYLFSVILGGEVLALNLANGTYAFNYSSSDLTNTVSVPVISNNIVYVGMDHGIIGLGYILPPEISISLPASIPAQNLGSSSGCTVAKIWTCGNWTSCTEGIQTRNCSFEYACGNYNPEPAEERNCGSPLKNLQANFSFSNFQIGLFSSLKLNISLDLEGNTSVPVQFVYTIIDSGNHTVYSEEDSGNFSKGIISKTLGNLNLPNGNYTLIVKIIHANTTSIIEKSLVIENPPFAVPNLKIFLLAFLIFDALILLAYLFMGRRKRKKEKIFVPEKNKRLTARKGK